MLLGGREKGRGKTTMREFKRVEDALGGIWIGTLELTDACDSLSDLSKLLTSKELG